MRRSRTLEKIRNGQVARMCSLGHFIPAYVCHAAENGNDCIWLDLEHRCFTNREVQALLAYFHQFDIDCLLRPPTSEKVQLYRYLEDGATGLMIPQVNTAEQARELARSVKFPPVGQRGLDGASFDSRFYLDPLDDYVEAANRETMLVVQIETPEAVRNCRDIASVSGVDGLFLGPGDLGLRLRNDPSEELDISTARKEVAEAAKAAGKFWGTPASDRETLETLVSEGAQLPSLGGDFGAMMKMLQSCRDDWDSVLGG